jgi:eukaryotic-like serine/threonine-protein kinase
VITLTLLHPVQSTPVQSWSFEHDPVVRIGRAVDNHVVLYSAVVSRYHVEVRFADNRWEVVNLGTNGTYLDGKRVHQAPLSTGNIMRLARSGPNIQVSIVEKLSDEGQSPAVSEATSLTDEKRTLSNADLVTANREPQLTELPSPIPVEPAIAAPFYVSGRYTLFQKEGKEEGSAALPPHPCNHKDAPDSALICTECGYPIHPIQEVGPFKGLRRLSASGNTLMAWREGHTVVLKTLPSEYLRNAELVGQFEDQARQLCQLEHPSMPKMFEAFEAQGQPYLASEMIYGPNLKEWVVQHGPVTQYQAIQWTLELSRLLNYLHQQAPVYLHQAITPANIVRPKVAHGSSQVVLVGFGETKGLTPESGTFTGTGGYISPEQHVGQGSAASDFYSLGTTLLYLLTGQEPEAFYRLGDNEFRLQIEDAPNLSPEATQIIQKLTYPQADQRFRSATAVIEALQALL